MALLVGARLWAVVAGRRRGGVYYLSGARQVRLLFWPLTGLVASLPFALSVARRAPDLPAPVLVGVGALAVALLSLSVPALLLHWRYAHHDGATAVRFDPGAGLLVVHRPDRPALYVRPGHVRAAVYTRAQARRAFWGQYETLRLTPVAAPDAPLTLTSAVLELAPVAAWLGANNVAVTERRRWLAWV